MIHKPSSARAERINGKVQEVITVARGFRNDENLRASVLFFCGHLDLFPHK
ncbi:MAG: transposase [Flavobacteriaceae bacterium]|nr:transposase [Flavobacteriaceae bacterium]MCY4268389.1 transposase [Flavobacteriaceae bacterium]MCY4298374.1 transposase [Flavobacteriaceae bacterium]